jgi:hypothetical protein
MTETETHSTEKQDAAKNANMARKLDAAGWGLFFIWTGIALLAGISWGIGLVGVGIITLVGQAARRHFGLRFDGFWVVVGILFAVRGIWELAGVELALTPILLVAAGIALLLSVFGDPNSHLRFYKNDPVP